MVRLVALEQKKNHKCLDCDTLCRINRRLSHKLQCQSQPDVIMLTFLNSNNKGSKLKDEKGDVDKCKC